MTLLFIIAFGVTGCVPGTSSPRPNSATTCAPDASETSTASQAVAIASIDGSRLVNRCVRVLTEPVPDLSGLIVLSTNKGGINFVLVDLKNGDKTNLGAGVRAVVSPDGKRVAFSDHSRKALIIEDVHGKLIREFSDPHLLLEPTGWLDNDRLTVDKQRPAGENNPPNLDALDIIDLATLGTKELLI